MFLVRSLSILFGCLLAGEGISALLRIPIPGSVIGMLLLTLTLQLRLVRVESVKSASDLLIKNLSLLFVPPGVGLMLYTDLLRQELLPLLAAFLISTILVLGGVGYLQQTLEQKDE